MSAFNDGFAKEAGGVAPFLRNTGRAMQRGAGSIMRGIRAVGRAGGELAGGAAGAVAAAPAAAAGKGVEVAGKAIRGVENRVRGSFRGGEIGGSQLKRRLRLGDRALAAAKKPPAAAPSAAPAAAHGGDRAAHIRAEKTRDLASKAKGLENSARRWRAGAIAVGGGAVLYGAAHGRKRDESYPQN